MQNSRIVVLDCETSTIHNGREPVCRYYMSQHLVTKRAWSDSVWINIVYTTLLEVFDKMKWDKNITGNVENELKKILKQTKEESFENHSFDHGFTIFWTKLQNLSTPYYPKFADEYKDAFTKLALENLCTKMPWKFIRGDGNDHFYYDKPVNGQYEQAPGTTIVDFDINNKVHRDEVVRVCFGPHILSIGILQFEMEGNQLYCKGNPYYREFQQTPHYVHSIHVQQIHQLTERQLKRSTHNITSLHEKLQSILQTNKNVIFVAHNAQQDRKWILQSIDDQVKYHQYLSCKSGSIHKADIDDLLYLQQLLKNEWSIKYTFQRKWFCTLHGSMNDDGSTRQSNNGAKAQIKVTAHTLDALYKHITGQELTKHHNALTDTYACALIYCHLKNISKDSPGYKRIRSLGLDTDEKQRPHKKSKATCPRQYDIYIDERILPPTFVTDQNTQVGADISLEFGGNYREEHLNNTIVLNTGSETRRQRLESADLIFGNLGGACIAFQLKDDDDGRRVEINTSCNYLLWGKNCDQIQDDLSSNENHRIDWDTPYFLYEQHTQETMCLKVIDLHPKLTSASDLPMSLYTKRMLLTLKQLCL
jgi:DNA polymerase III epsilon subunit-like protein